MTRQLKIAVITSETSGLVLARRLLDTNIALFIDNSEVYEKQRRRKSHHNLIPIYNYSNSQLFSALKKYEPDIILCFRAVRILISQIINIPKKGAFNLHTGPLPNYAGINVASWAIFNGETEHGVTLHWMDDKIDTGAIAYERHFPIKSDETGISLTSQCINVGFNLIQQLVSDLKIDNKIPKRQQDLSKRKYYSKSIPNNGFIDWHWPATKIERFVRASFYYPHSSPWGLPKARFGSKVFKIITSKVMSGNACPGYVLQEDSDLVIVGTADGVICLCKYLG